MAKRYEEKNKKIKNKKIGDMFLNLLLIVFVIMIIISLIQITKWYFNNKANKKVLLEISEAIKIEGSKDDENNYSIDFNSLKEKNPDTIAWLTVNGTNVDYSVVKAKNNDYYLNHNFNKEYNTSGWIFADYKNKFDGTDKNIVVYGHNVRDNSMFGSLKSIIKEEWYNNENNHKVIFITENEKAAYKVFSVYQIETEDYYIKTSFENDAEFEKFIDTIKNRSVKDFNVEITTEDDILTLSTCANNNKYRVVLHAKKIKE